MGETDIVQEVNYVVDDMSWKVRKGSAQIIECIAKLRADDMKAYYMQIVDKLRNMLNERDDGVRKEIVNAFIATIKSSIVESVDANLSLSISNMDSVMGMEGLSLDRQKSSFQDIVELIPDIIKKLIKMISDKKADNKLFGLIALSALTQAY